MEETCFETSSSWGSSPGPSAAFAEAARCRRERNDACRQDENPHHSPFHAALLSAPNYIRLARASVDSGRETTGEMASPSGEKALANPRMGDKCRFFMTSLFLADSEICDRCGNSGRIGGFARLHQRSSHSRSLRVPPTRRMPWGHAMAKTSKLRCHSLTRRRRLGVSSKSTSRHAGDEPRRRGLHRGPCAVVALALQRKPSHACAWRHFSAAEG